MTRFASWVMPEFDARGMTRWNWMCQHHERLEIGKGSDVGAFTYINAREGVSIGEHAQLGSHCSVYSHSTIDGKAGRVVIGRNARIGSHTTVMPGVTIGRNSIVGAHSFVNSDIPPDVLAYGVPAKVVRPLTEGERREPE